MGMFGDWPSPEAPSTGGGHGDERTVLFVCTGNVARSAAAELLARAGHGDLGLDYRSAGTAALVDCGIAVDVDEALRARAVDPDAHVAEQLTRGIADAAGLIVVAEAEHRDWLIDEWPDLIDRIVLLREAAAVAVDDPDLLSSTAELGAPLPARLVGACGDDPRWGIDDPFRRGPEAAELAVAEVAAALDALLPWYSSRLTG